MWYGWMLLCAIAAVMIVVIVRCITVSKPMPPPDCLDDFVGGQEYAERCCEECDFVNLCNSRSETMAKKTKAGIRKKMSKVVAAYIIDVTVGPQLMMMGMREPKRAEMLNNILIGMLTEHYEKNSELRDIDTPRWMQMAQQNCIELTSSFITARLATCLKDGIDPMPKILKPPGTMQNPPRMM